MRDIWLTEKHICNQMETSEHICDLMRGFSGETLIFREKPIYKKHTPDFLIADLNEGVVELSPLEVKVTATIDSITQIAKYEKIIRGLAYCNVSRPAPIKFARGYLVARYFDEKVREIAALIGWDTARIIIKNDQVVDLDWGDAEDPYFPLRPDMIECPQINSIIKKVLSSDDQAVGAR